MCHNIIRFMAANNYINVTTKLKNSSTNADIDFFTDDVVINSNQYLFFDLNCYFSDTDKEIKKVIQYFVNSFNCVYSRSGRLGRKHRFGFFDGISYKRRFFHNRYA